jgi:glutathione S-transferase
MLTLYLSPGSSSMAPHIALHEIGVEFESRWISFAKRRTVCARIPRAQFGGQGADPAHRRACDDRSRGDPLLSREALPCGGSLARERPRSRGAGDIVDVPLSPRRSIRRAGSAWNARERCSRSPNGGWERRDWTVGRYSIADIHVCRLFCRFVGSVRPAPAQFHGLCARHDRMMARPAVQRTLEIESAIGYQLPR